MTKQKRRPKDCSRGLEEEIAMVEAQIFGGGITRKRLEELMRQREDILKKMEINEIKQQWRRKTLTSQEQKTAR